MFFVISREWIFPAQSEQIEITLTLHNLLKVESQARYPRPRFAGFVDVRPARNRTVSGQGCRPPSDRGGSGPEGDLL
jgi:hypothetical protein